MLGNKRISLFKWSQFFTQVGESIVNRKDDMYEMDFLLYKLNIISVTDEMEEVIGVKPIDAYLDRDLLLVLDSEETVRKLKPNQRGRFSAHFVIFVEIMRLSVMLGTSLTKFYIAGKIIW